MTLPNSFNYTKHFSKMFFMYRCISTVSVSPSSHLSIIREFSSCWMDNDYSQLGLSIWPAGHLINRPDLDPFLNRPSLFNTVPHSSAGVNTQGWQVLLGSSSISCISGMGFNKSTCFLFSLLFNSSSLLLWEKSMMCIYPDCLTCIDSQDEQAKA